MAQADPDRTRWERIQGLLDALEEVTAGEHEDYLARVCPDPELRREALAMRAVEAESAGFLDGVAERLGRAPEPTRVRDLSGRRVGAYRLVQPLGRGGMGVVYEAERADGAFEQRVALKLLNLALAGTEAHGRFLAERQILAGLKHPAISHIVDGGITEDGTPWFAMEHVEGEPIDAYCDQRRLGIRERLELFLQVCDAVEHAHRRLVVHRDLKPVNVLVTEDGKVKLLDFGIAKLLDTGEPSPAVPPTRTALRLMTPEYASPEQVRGETVTTASDVYQLGLLLYELLSGHRPYVLRHRGGSELERVVCDQVPTRLSAAISREDTLKPTAGGSMPSIEEACRARRSSPARLQRRLRGDLDNIVLKALSKEPERRYGSADRLAQDIRRYLDGVPVTARSDTWVYRGRKFLGRHAIGTSAAAVVLVLVTGMAGFYTARVRSERDRAQDEAAKAEQVSEFLTHLFEGADPRAPNGPQLTARELLDRGVERVDRELSTQPELHSDMLRVLGRTYLELGVHDLAEQLLTRNLDLRRRQLGPEHPDVAEVLADFGLLRERQGQYERALRSLEEAIHTFETSLGDGAPEIAGVLRTQAAVYRSLGEHEKSQAALERALAIQRQVAGSDSQSTAVILNGLAVLSVDVGAFARAEELYQRTLAIYESELGADHPFVGNTLMNWASARAMRGKLDGVEAMFRRSLVIHEKTYGPDHNRMASVLNNLGNFLIGSGQPDKAIPLLQQALDIRSAALGPNHPDVAYLLASLGDGHFVGGRLREARHYYQQCVAVRREALSARRFYPVLVHSLVRIGRIEGELGNRVVADQNLNRATTIWSHAPDSVDPQLAPTLVYLSRWLAEQQRCREAVPLLRRALRLQIAQQPESSTGVAELERLLAGCEGSTELSTAGQT